MGIKALTNARVISLSLADIQHVFQQEPALEGRWIKSMSDNSAEVTGKRERHQKQQAALNKASQGGLFQTLKRLFISS